MRLIDPDNYQLGYDNYVEYPEEPKQLVFGWYEEDLIVTCSRGCGRMRECNPYSCQNDWKPTPSGSNYQ